eukprot:2069540-Amphidinium_carterae.1
MGNEHACALLDDGNVKCWGDNSGGQLGYGDTSTRGDDSNEMGDNLPNVDLNGETVLQLVAGNLVTCVIVTGGAVKCWGSYSYTGQGVVQDIGVSPGQMGANLPSLDFGSGRSATQLRAGYNTACAFLDDASVKCWGSDLYYGRLGYGDALDRGTSPCTMGDNLPAVDLGTTFTPAKLVQTGSYHSHCVISTTGTVKCWGRGAGGVLGYEDKVDRGDDPGEMGDNLPVVNFGDGLQVVDGSGGGGWSQCYLFTTQQVKCFAAMVCPCLPRQFMLEGLLGALSSILLRSSAGAAHPVHKAG